MRRSPELELPMRSLRPLMMRNLWIRGIGSSMDFVPDRSSHQCRLLSQSSRCHHIVAMDLEQHRQELSSRRRRKRVFDAFWR